MDKKFLIIFIVVVLGVAGGAYFIGQNQGYKAAKQDQEKLVEKVTSGTVNPVENLPSANPFETIKTDPFEGLYKNPFK